MNRNALCLRKNKVSDKNSLDVKFSNVQLKKRDATWIDARRAQWDEDSPYKVNVTSQTLFYGYGPVNLPPCPISEC